MAKDVLPCSWTLPEGTFCWTMDFVAVPAETWLSQSPIPILEGVFFLVSSDRLCGRDKELPPLPEGFLSPQLSLVIVQIHLLKRLWIWGQREPFGLFGLKQQEAFRLGPSGSLGEALNKHERGVVWKEGQEMGSSGFIAIIKEHRKAHDCWEFLPLSWKNFNEAEKS